jgi:8-oxo-dGTP diphosphatase
MAKRIILAAAIENKGRYLLTKQGKGGRQEGFWGFPGGNLEENEIDLQRSLKREIKEEVGLEIEIEGLIGTHLEIWKDDIQLIFFYFKAKRIGGRIKKSEEIEDFKWLTLKEIGKFPKDLIRPPFPWFGQMVKALRQNRPIDNIFF